VPNVSLGIANEAQWGRHRASRQELLINGSLGIALGAQPTDASIAVHPIIDIGLAVKAGDFSGFSAGVLSHDSPVVVRLTDSSESHSCFCHDTLCRQYVQKTNLALN
jgi:hypothetical protein